MINVSDNCDISNLSHTIIKKPPNLLRLRLLYQILLKIPNYLDYCRVLPYNKSMEKFTDTPTKNRVPSFDILRIFLIILVVNVHREHMTGSPPLFPGGFGWYAVPLFVLLSFFLMSKLFVGDNPPFSMLAKRVKRFFIPFLFWSGIGFLVDPQAFNLRNVGIQLFTGGVINVPLYYLLVMVIFTTFFWLLTRLSLSKRIITMVLVTIGAFYLQYSGKNYAFFSQVEPAIMYCYGRLAELLPYASTGIIVGLMAAHKTSTKTFMLLTALIGGFYFANHSLGQPSGVDYSGLLYYFGSLFIFMYFFLVRVFRLPEKIEQQITMLGAYSFGVYVAHYLFLEIVWRYISISLEWNKQYPVGFLLIFVAICYGFIIGADKLTRYRFSYLFK